MKILHRKFLEPQKKGYERKKKCQNSIDTSAENTYFRTKKINIETLSKCGKKDIFILLMENKMDNEHNICIEISHFVF